MLTLVVYLPARWTSRLLADLSCMFVRQVDCDEVSRALRQVEWNVSKAVSSLMVRHGAAGQATVV